MRKEYLIILIILTAFLGLLAYYFLLSRVSIVKTSLEQDAKEVSLNPQIIFQFDRSARSVLKNVLISSNPEAVWEVEIVDSRSIKISPKKELFFLTTYKVTVSGERINAYTLTFTTKDAEFGVGTPDAQEAFDNYEKAFPILKFLPYRADEYTIMQRERDHYFVIVPEIYQDTIDMEKAKAAVFAWFKEHGVDPNAVRIDLY